MNSLLRAASSIAITTSWFNQSEFRIRNFVVGGALLISAAAASADTFTDQDFNPSDWSQAVIGQTGPAVSFSTGQVLAGGNSGAYRSITHSYGGPGSIITGHIYDAASYNLGVEGALASVSYTFDARVFDGGDSGGVLFRALLLQDNNYYYAGYALALPGGWQSQSILNLTAADFVLIYGSGSATPDFSAGGSPIEFGFLASNGTGNYFPTSTSSGIDNWQVVTTAASPGPSEGPSSVPDQGGFLLYVIGVAALVLGSQFLPHHHRVSLIRA